MNKVAVIMGAGASYDVWNETTPVDQNWRPPLAKDLFQRPGFFFPVAEVYEGAKVAWSMLSPRSKGPDAFDLEAALREMASDDDERIRRHFKEVPLYLRDLLHLVEERYVTYPTTHVEFLTVMKPDVRVNAAFITLNYDRYIERALQSFDPRCQFADIDSYWRNPTKLFKIHGSIDWAVPMNREPTDWKQALWDFDPTQRTEEVLKVGPPPSLRSRDWTGGPNGNWHLYPVLTAPLAKKGDEDIVCPPRHREALNDFLHDCRCYLIVGSSGLDNDLLDLLRNQAAVADVLHVVAGDPEQAEQSYQRYRDVPQLRTANWAALGGGFMNYVRSKAFNKFLKLVEGLPPK